MAGTLLQAGIDRLAFESKHTKHAFMHTAERFLANEAF